jgi:hypothetical protein
MKKYLLLSLLISGAAYAQSQQTLTTPTQGTITVSVIANQNTLVWTTNNSTQVLAITVPSPPCILYTADNSAAWYIGGTGYTFNRYSDLVPNKNLTITCSTSQTVYIAEGH